MRASLSLRVSSRRAWLGVVCVLGVVAVVLGVRPGVPTPARAAVSVTFTSTGSEQTFVVPAGVTSMHVVAIGAPGNPGHSFNEPGGPGGGPGGPGGKGARVETDIAVTPGQTLYIEVACPSSVCAAYGDGGGATDVRTVSSAQPNSLASRLVVAGGGGGGGDGGYFSNAAGGAGGDAGQPGAPGVGTFAPGMGTLIAGGGGAGTLSAGGAGGGGGNPADAGTAGRLGVGGRGGSGSDSGGGDAGDGCYGGGGGGGSDLGGGGGGGGGSSCVYVNGIAQPVAFTLDSTGIPLVTLSYTPPTPTPTPTPAPAGPQLPPGFSPPIQTLITTLQPDCTRISTSLSLPPNTPVSVFLGQFTPSSAVVSITRVDPVTGQTQLLYSTDPQAQVQGQTVGPGQTLSICVNSPAKYTYTSP